MKLYMNLTYDTMDLVGFAWSGSFRLQFNNEANKHVSRKVFTILWDLEDHRH